jgi:hypothetical protein
LETFLGIFSEKIKKVFKKFLEMEKGKIKIKI